MNLQGKVRRLYYREGLTLSEIERRTGADAQDDPQVVEGARGG